MGKLTNFLTEMMTVSKSGLTLKELDARKVPAEHRYCAADDVPHYITDTPSDGRFYNRFCNSCVWGINWRSELIWDLYKSSGTDMNWRSWKYTDEYRDNVRMVSKFLAESKPKHCKMGCGFNHDSGWDTDGKISDLLPSGVIMDHAVESTYGTPIEHFTWFDDDPETVEDIAEKELAYDAMDPNGDNVTSNAGDVGHGGRPLYHWRSAQRDGLWKSKNGEWRCEHYMTKTNLTKIKEGKFNVRLDNAGHVLKFASLFIGDSIVEDEDYEYWKNTMVDYCKNIFSNAVENHVNLDMEKYEVVITENKTIRSKVRKDLGIWVPCDEMTGIMAKELYTMVPTVETIPVKAELRVKSAYKSLAKIMVHFGIVDEVDLSNKAISVDEIDDVTRDLFTYKHEDNGYKVTNWKLENLIKRMSGGKLSNNAYNKLCDMYSELRVAVPEFKVDYYDEMTGIVVEPTSWKMEHPEISPLEFARIALKDYVDPDELKKLLISYAKLLG